MTTLDRLEALERDAAEARAALDASPYLSDEHDDLWLVWWRAREKEDEAYDEKTLVALRAVARAAEKWGEIEVDDFGSAFCPIDQLAAELELTTAIGALRALDAGPEDGGDDE